MSEVQRKMLFPLLLCLFFFPHSSAAKERAVPNSPLPGEILSTSGGNQIIFENGRSLFWPKQGPLLLKGKDGTILARVDLLEKAKKKSGAEAMGLDVEEADLGGSMGNKSYLSGKKQPHGRKLEAEVLAGRSQADQAGQQKESIVQGIPLTTIEYPNGSTLLRMKWPDLSEEVYFDRRKTMVYNQQTRKADAFSYSMKQYADGSFQRSYHLSSGELNVTYDTHDKSYNFAFSNAQGEVVAEINCQESCSGE